MSITFHTNIKKLIDEQVNSDSAKICCNTTIINSENIIKHLNEIYTFQKNKINNTKNQYENTVNLFEGKIKSEKSYVILNEKFDIQKCHEFLLSGTADESYYLNVHKYMATSRPTQNKNIYFNNVGYIYPKNCIGRFKTVVLNKRNEQIHTTSQTSMWGELKSYVLRNMCWDVDMVNAHHAILEQLMEKHNMDTTHIKKYNSNRDFFMKQIMDSYKYTRKQAKAEILRFTYGMDSLTSSNEFKLLPQEIKDFIYEIRKTKKLFLDLYPQYLEEAKERNDKNKKTYNHDGSAFALYLQTYERKVLECMLEYFTKFGYNVIALIYDGMHLDKSKEVTQDVLNDCSKYIKDKLDLNIKLAIKEFENIDLSKLPVKKNFDPLDKEYLEEHKMLNTICCNKICPIEKNDPFENVKIFDKNGKLKKFIILKSATGDGKTYLAKKIRECIEKNKGEIIKKYVSVKKERKMNGLGKYGFTDDYIYSGEEDYEENIPDIKFLSIVSRRSLSYSHEKEFNLTNYLKTDKHGLNEVYQLDSIDKFKNENNDFYVVFLDEIASLCSHFNNGMAKMSSQRLKMVEIFKNIINSPKCLMVYGCDDNLNSGTIFFLKRLTNKPIEVYINNKIVKYDQMVNMHVDKNHIIKQMKEDIKNNIKIYACSSSCSNFFRTVIRPIISELKLKKEEYLIYSGNYGEKIKNEKEETNKIIQEDNLSIEKGDIITSKWNDVKIVFCTPAIIYGVSYDVQFSHKVYGFYFKNSTMNALLCYQQISRIRHPISFELYTEIDCSIKPDMNLEYRKEIVYNGEYSKIIDDKLPNYDNRVGITDLFIFDEYVKSHYNDLYFYIPYLLKKKGYTNINVITEKTEEQDSLTKDDYIDILVKEYNDGILDEKKLDNVSIYMRSFGFDSQMVNTDPELKHIEKEIRNKCMNVFIDDAGTRCLTLYSNSVNRKFEENIKNYNDANILLANSEDYRIKILDDMHKLLQIEWFDKNLVEKLKKMNSDKLEENIVLPEYIQSALKKKFRFRGKNIPTKYVKIVSLLLSEYNMFSNKVTESQKDNLSYMHNGKQERTSIRTISKYVDTLDTILNYSENISKLKAKRKDKKDEEFKEYAF